MTTLVHLSDIHFGRDVDLAQIDVLGALIPTFAPAAIVISGDLTQRSRHGELQRALVFTDRLRAIAPTLIVPGNHDVEWWKSPLHLAGTAPIYAKYRRYFGDDLSPSLAVPGFTIASVLSSHGVAFGSLTWKLWRDTAVKGHIPADEVVRAAALFRSAPPSDVRAVVLHHNVLRGQISRRMGLARWRAAQQALIGSGADLVICGHDHQEGIESLEGMVISTASTHCTRTRGHRPSAFNLIEATDTELILRHQVWDRSARAFHPTGPVRFPRRAR